MEVTADSVLIIDGLTYAGDYIIKMLKRREKELQQWRVKAKKQYKRKIEDLSTDLSTLHIPESIPERMDEIPESIPERTEIPESIPERTKNIPERTENKKYNSQYRDDSLDILPDYIRHSVLQREKDGTGIKIPKLNY